MSHQGCSKGKTQHLHSAPSTIASSPGIACRLAALTMNWLRKCSVTTMSAALVDHTSARAHKTSWQLLYVVSFRACWSWVGKKIVMSEMLRQGFVKRRMGMTQRISGGSLRIANTLCAVLCPTGMHFADQTGQIVHVAPEQPEVLAAESAVDSDDDEKSPPARWLHLPDPPADRLPVPKAQGRLPGRKAGEVLPRWSISCYVIGCRWRNSRRARIMPKRVPLQTLPKGIAKICHGPFVADGATSACQAMGDLSPVAPLQTRLTQSTLRNNPVAPKILHEFPVSSLPHSHPRRQGPLPC